MAALKFVSGVEERVKAEVVEVVQTVVPAIWGDFRGQS